MEIIITLLDGKELTFNRNEISEITQNFGDGHRIYERCGNHHFLGHVFCPDCKAKYEAMGIIAHCGEMFVYKQVRGEPESIEVGLKNGSTLLAKSIKLWPVNWVDEGERDDLYQNYNLVTF
jgi:hypothetical protein